MFKGVAVEELFPAILTVLEMVQMIKNPEYTGFPLLDLTTLNR
jgi:hypothetical protein